MKSGTCPVYDRIKMGELDNLPGGSLVSKLYRKPLLRVSLRKTYPHW